MTHYTNELYKRGIAVRCTCCGTVVGHIYNAKDYEPNLLCISCFADMKSNGMDETEIEILKEWER